MSCHVVPSHSTIDIGPRRTLQAHSPFFGFVRMVEAEFHKQWFALDHIHLLGDKQLVDRSDKLELVWDKRERGAVPFIPLLKPYHGVYIMRKK